MRSSGAVGGDDEIEAVAQGAAAVDDLLALSDIQGVDFDPTSTSQTGLSARQTWYTIATKSRSSGGCRITSLCDGSSRTTLSHGDVCFGAGLRGLGCRRGNDAPTGAAGSWSAPQTIFNAKRDAGLCHFIHRAVNAENPTGCDELSPPLREAQSGGNYAPYIMARFTAGDEARGTSTIYYAMTTWNPYGQVIMKAMIARVP